MNESGQSSVELMALLPVIAVVALAIGQMLAAGAAREAAAAVAQAAAMAHLQGGDPERAARAAAPQWAKNRMRLVLKGRAAHVTIAPRAVLPGVVSLLAAHAVADAGPR